MLKNQITEQQSAQDLIHNRAERFTFSRLFWKRRTITSSLKKYKINGKTVWRVRWVDGYKPDGSVIQREKRFSTYAEARAFDIKTQNSIATGTYVIPSRVSLAEWIDTWCEDYLPIDRKPKTITQYLFVLDKIKGSSLGHYKLQDLKPDVLQKYFTSALKKGKPSSVHDSYRKLKKVLSDAVKADKIPYNPCDRVTVPKPKSKEPILPTDEQLCKLLENFRNDSLGNAMELLLHTGLRVSELLGITSDEIDIKNRVLTVRHQLAKDDGVFHLAPTKTNSTRRIPLSDRALELIKNERRSQFLNEQECAELWCNDMNLLFTDKIGDPINHFTFADHLKACGKRVGIENLHPHVLRHLFTSRLLQNGTDVKTIATLLGHASVDVTLSIYSHSTDASKVNAINTLDESLKALVKAV